MTTASSSPTAYNEGEKLEKEKGGKDGGSKGKKETNNDEKKGRSSNKTEQVHEWILWEHKYGKRVKTDLQWRDATAEVCHFFHNAVVDTADIRTNSNDDGGGEKTTSKSSETQEHHPFSVDLHHLPMPSDVFFKEEGDDDATGHNRDSVSHHDNKHQKHKPRLAPRTHKEYSLFKKGIFPDWEDEHCWDGGCWYVRNYYPPRILDHYWRNLVRAVVDEDRGIDVKHVVGIRIDDKSDFKHLLCKIEIWMDTRDFKARDDVRRAATAVMLEGRPDVGGGGKVNPLKLRWRNFDVKPAADGTAASDDVGGGDSEHASSEK